MQSLCYVPLVAVLCLMVLPECKGASTKVRRFMDGKSHAVFMDAPEKAAKQEQQAEPAEDKDSAIHWSGISDIPIEVAQLFGIAWVLVLGSTPIFIYKVDDRPVTKTGIVLASVMWVALFGGLFLFTNIILFQSSHFDRVRSLTIIECTYFMTQVITTVGYGDITPAYPRGQVFVGFYVVLAFFVIAFLVSEMQAIVVTRLHKYKEILSKHTGMTTSASRSNIIEFKPSKPEVSNLVISGLGFIFVASAWILFYHYFPGENKPWTEACYMALITLTTVGFGAVTPNTEAGMMFGAFFMFIGTAALVSVVTNFSSFSLEMAEWEAWDPKKFQTALKDLKKKGKGHGLSEIDFMTFTLIQKHILSEEEVDEIKAVYQTWKTSEGGLQDRLRLESVADLGGVDMPDSTRGSVTSETSRVASARKLDE